MAQNKTTYQRRIFFLLSFLILILFALLGRCFQLQYLRWQHYHQLCVKQQKSTSPRNPQRGIILDRRGKVLAASNVVRTVFVEPRVIDDPKVVSNRLAPILDMPAHIICKKITDSKNPGYAKIMTGATVKQCREAKKIYSVGIQYNWRRYYPTENLVSHIVGFTSRDNRGLAGIEFKYNEQLMGTPGRRMFLTDSHRRPVCPLYMSNEDDSQQQSFVDVVNGSGIITTIDTTIQQFVREELLKQYKLYQADSAVAIMAEPKTGAILAMVSLPDFDPNKAATTKPEKLLNRAVTFQFEPGSIIKPVAVAIALDAGVISKNQKIFCENGLYYRKKGSGMKGFGRIREYKHGFADLTIKEILIHSSNIGMAKIGQKLGAKKIYDGLTLFGFGKKTGIELPGEATGLLRKPSLWTSYSVPRIPFGQEISVTAIQMIKAFCILANKGRLVNPYIVQAVVDSKGKISTLRRPIPPVGYIVKPDVAQWLTGDALVAVVNEGTGKRARLEQWQLFGKTGTAQLARTDGRGYEDGAYIASFMCGAPADDPAVVLLVSIRKPNRSLGKGYTGGTVAAPVAAKILRKTLTYLDIPQRETSSEQ